tara:strand:- start:185 stop:298 length:114 start_codon:yes stop_codon:yes gene_type:complete
LFLELDLQEDYFLMHLEIVLLHHHLILRVFLVYFEEN